MPDAIPAAAAGSRAGARDDRPLWTSARPARSAPPLRELAAVLAVVVAGAAVAIGCDAWVGGLDGQPAVYFLIALALPWWAALPARVGERAAVLAGLWCAVAALWYVLAMAAPAPWWRGAGAFAVACLAVGWAALLAGWLGRRPRS